METDDTSSKSLQMKMAMHYKIFLTQDLLKANARKSKTNFRWMEYRQNPYLLK